MEPDIQGNGPAAAKLMEAFRRREPAECVEGPVITLEERPQRGDISGKCGRVLADERGCVAEQTGDVRKAVRLGCRRLHGRRELLNFTSRACLRSPGSALRQLSRCGQADARGHVPPIQGLQDRLDVGHRQRAAQGRNRAALVRTADIPGQGPPNKGNRNHLDAGIDGKGDFRDLQQRLRHDHGFDRRRPDLLLHKTNFLPIAGRLSGDVMPIPRLAL